MSRQRNNSIAVAMSCMNFLAAIGTDIPMKMTWHPLAFNKQEQIGFGEYTFEMHGRYHGIVVVKLEAGLIKHWREYQYQTELGWEEFTNHNPF